MGPQSRKDTDKLEQVQQRVAKLVRETCPVKSSYRNRLQFRLQKRRLQGDLLTDFQYLQGGNQEDGARLLMLTHSEKRQ